MIVDWNKETVMLESTLHALLDVENWFHNHSISLKRERMYNQKGVQQILSAMVENVDYMLEVGGEMEMYYNKEQKKLVVWKDEYGF